MVSYVLLLLLLFTHRIRYDLIIQLLLLFIDAQQFVRSLYCVNSFCLCPYSYTTRFVILHRFIFSFLCMHKNRCHDFFFIVIWIPCTNYHYTSRVSLENSMVFNRYNMLYLLPIILYIYRKRERRMKDFVR